MQRNDSSRMAVLPQGPRFNSYLTMQNEDIMRELGLTTAEIESVNTRARAECSDSLVVLCESRGLADLSSLFSA